MTEVEKLKEWCEQENCTIGGITLGPEAANIPEAERSEVIAAEINRLNEWMRDPVNSLTARIEGHLFLKSDYVMCIENQCRISSEEPHFIPVPPTEEEKRKIRGYREDITLFREAIFMIKQLDAELRSLKKEG